MASPSILGLVCLVAMAVMSPAQADDVMELSDSNFDQKLADVDLALVMFYAPWCGHCKRLKPEFEKAAGILLAEDPPITLAKTDCTEDGKQKCQDNGVSGYPTLKIFRGGKVTQDYNGPRDASGIVKYMMGMSGPSAKPIKSQADLDKFKSKDDSGVVGFFSSGSSLKKTFATVADSMREKIRFGLVEDAALAGDYDGKIVLFRPKHLDSKFESGAVVYEGKDESGAVQDFVNDNYRGLVGHRTQDNAEFFRGVNTVVAYYSVDYVKNPKGTNYWRNRLLKVVSKLQDNVLASKKVVFAVSDKDDFQHEVESFGLGYVKGDKPRVCILGDNGKNKYVMEAEFSMDTFEQFLKDWVDGKIDPYIKSEDIPSGDGAKDGEVLVGVAKNFDALVRNSDRDTLVEFYAPWCGHCKKLAPVYKEVAEELLEEAVDLVKFDATANDVPPEYDVTGFPTLYWVPKGKKSSPVRYQGGREKDDFIKYIAKEATEELQWFDRKGEKRSVRKDEL